MKNQFTGQSAKNAKRQYVFTRDNRELLFAFKKRALVHFAVDPDEVYMTTKLDGSKTFWFPFNKGHNNGKGNPPNSGGYKTSYLWEEILAKERFGTEFEEADKLFFDQIEAELVHDETLQTQARVNKIDTFKYAFEELFLSKLIDRMNQNQDIFEKILEDKAFGSLVREWMMKKVYARLNEHVG